MKEKTLDERIEEELKDQLIDISMLNAGTPEKTEAIKGFTALYEKRQSQKEHKTDRAIRIGEGALKAVGYVAMFVIGLNFEKTGTLTSNFFRNLVGKTKFMD